jgi:hypothetical protein
MKNLEAYRRDDPYWQSLYASATEENYEEFHRRLLMMIAADDWRLAMEFRQNAAPGDVGTIRIGAETLLRLTANDDGTVTLDEVPDDSRNEA